MAPNSDVTFYVKVHQSRNVSHFKPLLVLFRFFGIELNPFVNISCNGKRFRILKEFVLFFLHVFIHLSYTVFLLKTDVEHKLMASSTSDSSIWNFIIDYCNYIILAIGVHAIILNLSHSNEWKSLWQNLNQVTKKYGTFEPFRSSCRRIVYSGIILLLVVCPIAFPI